VLDQGAPLAPLAIFEAGVPVLGICYGEQVMAAQLGGRSRAAATIANSAAPRSR
jgi:GMP synthase (glutamine-hydrolysing)